MDIGKCFPLKPVDGCRFHNSKEDQILDELSAIRRLLERLVGDPPSLRTEIRVSERQTPEQMKAVIMAFREARARERRR